MECRTLESFKSKNRTLRKKEYLVVRKKRQSVLSSTRRRSAIHTCHAPIYHATDIDRRALRNIARHGTISRVRLARFRRY